MATFTAAVFELAMVELSHLLFLFSSVRGSLGLDLVCAMTVEPMLASP
jgi:hypothetical protein